MAWLILPAGLTAIVYRAVGGLAARYPETMAGYNTMSAERRRHVDIRAAGRCVARYCRAAGCVSLAGAEAPMPGLPEVWSLRIFGASAAVPVALLPVGSFRASWKYDAEFLKRPKK